MKVFSVDDIEKQARQGQSNILVNSFDAVPMSVIEDIRKEIEEEIDKCHSNGKYSYDNSRIGLRKALEIIDKHIYQGTKQ